MNIKQNKAITLIALIITIIILLILAGVVIITLTGENGILSNTSEAKDKQKVAEYKELLYQYLLEIHIDEYIDNVKLTSLEDIKKKLEEKNTIKGAKYEVKQYQGEDVIMVTTEDGYVFVIKDREVMYIGKEENLNSSLQKITMEDLLLSYYINEIEATKDTWTNKDVTVEVKSNIDIGDCKVMTSKDGISWEDKTTQTFTENGIMYVALFNGINYGEPVLVDVNNIDKEKPKIDKIIGSTEIGVTGNITLSNIYDEGDSGLAGIFISTNNTAPTLEDSGWINNTESSYVIQVAENGTYNVWIKDVAGNISDLKTCSVSGIVKAISSIKVNDIKVGIGESAQLQVTTMPENNVEELTYTSSDETIAKVDNTGKVTIAENATVGSIVTITVTGKLSTNVKGTCTVTVVKSLVNVSREQIATDPKSYYGKQVVNYKTSDSDTNVYRIFYIDTDNYFGDGVNTVYLKADYHGGVSCSTTYDANETKVIQMNPLWAAKRGSSTWKNNEKASAWLCDPTKWTDYCNYNYAKYAIGGPSIEMFVKSYEHAFKNTDIPILGAKYSYVNSYGYKYTLNGTQSYISNNDYTTGENTVSRTYYNSMYAGKNSEKIGTWWISSPSDYSTGNDALCRVNGTKATLGSTSYTIASGISPLICLKPDSSIIIEK